MAKITKDPGHIKTITVKTTDKKKVGDRQGFKWWLANSKKQLCEEVLDSASFLKDNQSYRYRQSGIYGRMYGNVPLFSAAGFSGGLGKQGGGTALPLDRPTMNVVQSCVDTLVSRISQSRPRPVFLTDNGDSKQRTLAKQMNSFINGELYQCKAHELGALILRDAAVLGTGCIKIFETADHRVGLERVLFTELFVDPNDAFYGDPRQMFHLKLIDKAVLAELFPDARSDINKAEQGVPDSSGESGKTLADQVIVAEAWHLPSGKDAGDGRHVIVCSSGVILDEEWKKDKFPFVFHGYSPRLVGFWSQGLTEQLLGTQVEINKLLMTISKSINLVGVPRVFVEKGSKVVRAHLNNEVGSIVEYQGTKPEYEVAPCVPQELYAQLERLVQYAYQQSGISALSATSQKPAGLNSGEAIRNYDDLQSDRFAALSRRYDTMYVDLAYQIIHLATEIAERDGSYQTVYPDKNGTQEIDFPATKLLDNPFVIQCADASSLPRDPAGRLEAITERMQAGLYTPDEGRRKLGDMDLQQEDNLLNAGEERILRILDQIVEDGKYTPPDPFMDPQLALRLCTQYYNLYEGKKLEESRAQMLRDFFTQIQTLQQAAMPPPTPGGAPGAPGGAPQAVPTAPPVSPMLPNAPQS